MVINALRMAPSADLHSRFLVPLMAVIAYLFVALPAGAADRPASFADQVEAPVACRGQHLDNHHCQ